MADLEIATSETGWTSQPAAPYSNETSVQSLDETNAGIEPDDQERSETSRRAKLSSAEILALCVVSGVAIAGLGVMIGAFFGPESTFVLALLIGGGAALTLSGGWIAIYILTRSTPQYRIEST